MSRYLLSFLLAVIVLRAVPATAQDIFATVAPNVGNSDNFVDIPNPSGGALYFFTDPSPAAARMAKVSGGTQVELWPTAPSFRPDPGLSLNRLFSSNVLRVYPKTLSAGTTIQIEFSYSPTGTRYYYRVLVTAGVQVTSIATLDPSPTAEVLVRWRATFDSPVSNVTASNFALSSNTGSTAGVSITSVVPDSAQPSSSWTITANTGSFLGLLFLNWAGTRTESPPVPNTFTGAPYTFQSFPFFDVNLGPVTVNRGTPVTLTAHATMRNGATVYYQWYTGARFDINPVAIPGATGTSLTVGPFNTLGTYNYHCAAHATPLNPSNSLARSETAAITVVDPPQITSAPASTLVAAGQSVTLSVSAVGTSLQYQWFRGESGDTSNAVTTLGDFPTYTTPSLNTTSSYWVRVTNGGPTVANSATARVTVVGAIAPAASGSANVNSVFAAPPAVIVRDGLGNPVPQVQVTFVVPTSGPSGRFNGTLLAVAPTTGNDGIAATPPFTANGTPGAYNVVASVAGFSCDVPMVNLPTLNGAAIAGFTNTDSDAPYDLATATGATPGGTFSGPGVAGGVFTPANAGRGQHTITYSASGAQVSFTITVVESPSLIVTTGTDVVTPADGLTSLREAIQYAESRAGADTITFAPALLGQTVTVVNGWGGAGDDTAFRTGTDLTIEGGTGVTIHLAAPAGRRHFLCGGGTLTLRNLTLTGADLRGVNDGGALYNIATCVVENVRFLGNRANNGGAICSTSALTVSRSLFFQNTAEVLGGAIISSNGLTVASCNFSTNQSSFNGGALRLDGTAAISSSTFSNNTAVNGGGAIMSHGQTTLTNTTIAYNTALDGGGAQFFDGTANVRHATFAYNTASRSGGGAAVNLANVTMINTIIAGNAAPDQANLWGSALNAASSHNLINTPTAQLYLGNIADNGGPSPSIALQPGSPAINAGTVIAGVTTDQRGFPRRTIASGGLLGRYYRLGATPTPALLAPLSNLEALAPAASVITPRVDFGDGTETSAGDGTVLDRGGSLGNYLGGLGVSVGNQNFAALWTGFITVPETADYRFTTRSDDGSVLSIDGELVVDNNLFQGMTNRSGTVRLTAGLHAVRLAYFQAGGGGGMQWSWEQLNGNAPFARQIVPPHVLAAGSLPDIGAVEDADGNDDPDSDSLTNATELAQSTNPLSVDTDGDGFNDATEILNGTDPRNQASVPPATRIERVVGAGAARGLDLTGNFVYAVNVGTPGAVGAIGDAIFTADNVAGVTVTAPNEIANWTIREFGSTPADNALEALYRSIRWGGSTNPVQVSAANLVPGRNYKLQLLFADAPGANRAFDIRVNGTTIVPGFNTGTAQGPAGAGNAASAVVHEFTAPTSTLQVELTGLNTPAPFDPNPILNGFTLEEIPTAATAPLIGPVAGTFPGSVTVTLSTVSAGATIRYTIDGSAPTETSGFVYSNPFDLTASASVRAIAVGGGWLPSPVSSANYTVLARPLAGPDTIYRYPTQSTKIAAAALLDNDSSPEGRTPLTLTSVSLAASGQATVTLSGGQVFYRPVQGFTGADSFTYTVADSAGVTSTGTVNVSLMADATMARNLTAVALESAQAGGHQARIRFAGIPGRTYRIESTDSLAPLDWQSRGTVTADAMGRIEFVDPPPLPPSRFYRTVTP